MRGQAVCRIETVKVMEIAAMLWTGGKDSALALHEAARDGYCVRRLVTFVPPEPDFLAHPLDFMSMQARALDLPHRVVPVSPPFEEGYEVGLRELRDAMGIDCVVTGDIAEVSGYPNWIRERGHAIGMRVHTPLWGRDRNSLLAVFLEQGFKACISCVDIRSLDESWVGRELDEEAISELRRIGKRNGLDLSGENGEYHTMLVDGPRFRQRIDIRSYSVLTTDSLAHMEIHGLEVVGKESA